MTPASFRLPRAVLALSVASALAGCDTPVIVEREGPAVCREPFSPQGAAPLADSLLVIVETPTLTAEQERRLSLARAQETAGRVLVARLTEPAEPLLQPGREFVLSVSPARAFVLVGQQLSSGSGYVGWHGRIAGEIGEAGWVLTHEGITGGLQSIPTDGTVPSLYSIHPLGGGLHAVICLDPSKFGPD
jgi:hypothetical protein